MIPGTEVEEIIGHAPGGVCPFAIRPEVEVYLDESLKRFEIVYPAAGSANSAVCLNITELEICAEPKSPDRRVQRLEQRGSRVKPGERSTTENRAESQAKRKAVKKPAKKRSGAKKNLKTLK